MQFSPRRPYPAGDFGAFGVYFRLRRLGVFAVRYQIRRRRGQGIVGPNAGALGALPRHELNGENPLVGVQQVYQRFAAAASASLIQAERDYLGERPGFVDKRLAEPALGVADGGAAVFVFDDDGHASALRENDVRARSAPLNHADALACRRPLAARSQPVRYRFVGGLLMQAAEDAGVSFRFRCGKERHSIFSPLTERISPEGGSMKVENGRRIAELLYET